MFSLYLMLAAFVGLLHAKSSTGDSVLVILDNKLNRSDYSLFFDGLEGTYESCLLFLFNLSSQSKGIVLPSVLRETALLRSRNMTHPISTTLLSSHHTQKVRFIAVHLLCPKLTSVFQVFHLTSRLSL